ncbi:hypothetical protein CP532_1538 [Ophiocordyceps camponoti-leonardi (nom. inval.)]|nr:hypothetical protein CP532_1538 [Ophiocordyceps camponoti-leonardi (nom. inval.)]
MAPIPPPSLTFIILLLYLLSVAVITTAAPGRHENDPVRWQLDDVYDASNFFDKFDFYTGRSGDGGYARFVDRSEAFRKGLIYSDQEGIHMGPDSRSTLNSPCHRNGSPGRDSVRIESKSRYNHGLIIARFNHLPRMNCGFWPAFWTYGRDWPYDGEVNLLEGYNLNSWNQPGFRTGRKYRSDQCLLRPVPQRQSAAIYSETCTREGGCYAADARAFTDHTAGGIFAMEWTREFIKLYRWRPGSEPRDINSDQPDTSRWGTPMVYLLNSDCDIDDHFSNQRIVLSLDFCGDPAGMPDVWKGSCEGVTRETNCVDFVAKNPSAYADSYFKIKDIRYFAPWDGRRRPETSSSYSRPQSPSHPFSTPTLSRLTRPQTANESKDRKKETSAASTRKEKMTSAPPLTPSTAAKPSSPPPPDTRKKSSSPPPPPPQKKPSSPPTASKSSSGRTKFFGQEVDVVTTEEIDVIADDINAHEEVDAGAEEDDVNSCKEDDINVFEEVDITTEEADIDSYYEEVYAGTEEDDINSCKEDYINDYKKVDDGTEEDDISSCKEDNISAFKEVDVATEEADINNCEEDDIDDCEEADIDSYYEEARRKGRGCQVRFLWEEVDDNDDDEEADVDTDEEVDVDTTEEANVDTNEEADINEEADANDEEVYDNTAAEKVDAASAKEVVARADYEASSGEDFLVCPCFQVEDGFL